MRANKLSPAFHWPDFWTPTLSFGTPAICLSPEVSFGGGSFCFVTRDFFSFGEPCIGFGFLILWGRLTWMAAVIGTGPAAISMSGWKWLKFMSFCCS